VSFKRGRCSLRLSYPDRGTTTPSKACSLAEFDAWIASSWFASQPTLAQVQTYSLTVQAMAFQPASLQVPAGVKIKLLVNNANGKTSRVRKHAGQSAVMWPQNNV
jgi:hypothetical protein